MKPSEHRVVIALCSFIILCNNRFIGINSHFGGCIMNGETKQRIREHLSSVMERLIHRRTILEPFDEEAIAQNNPFGYRLVPVEVWKGSKFERSFVTSLGQGIFEQLGLMIAEGTGSYASNQHSENLTINTWRIEKIDEILKMQRSNSSKAYKPNWDSEVHQILQLENQKFEDITVIADLYIKRPNGKEEYYSFKTVKPNLDQTERAKRDMLRLKATKPDCEPYFALPFNPAGEGQVYSKAFKMPYKLFDMDNDSSVLIGGELWNKIGDNETTYTELLNLFDEVGEVYSQKIRKDYFGL